MLIFVYFIIIFLLLAGRGSRPCVCGGGLMWRLASLCIRSWRDLCCGVRGQKGGMEGRGSWPTRDKMTYSPIIPTLLDKVTCLTSALFLFLSAFLFFPPLFFFSFTFIFWTRWVVGGGGGRGLALYILIFSVWRMTHTESQPLRVINRRPFSRAK